MYRLLEIVLPQESGEALRSLLEDAEVIANWRGIRARTWWEADKARKSTCIAMALWVTALALLVALMLLT